MPEEQLHDNGMTWKRCRITDHMVKVQNMLLIKQSFAVPWRTM